MSCSSIQRVIDVQEGLIGGFVPETLSWRKIHRRLFSRLPDKIFSLPFLDFPPKMATNDMEKQSQPALPPPEALSAQQPRTSQNASDDVEKQSHTQPPALPPQKSSPLQQPPTPQNASHLSPLRLALVTTSLCLSAVLYGLDMNIIGVAVPVITTQFHSLDDISWYSVAYLLAITAFQPAFGNVYKYFPAKRVFGGSVVVFEGTYAVCWIEWNGLEGEVVSVC
jgi:hypothetical protein